jgi:DnaK suppressor protein
MTDIIDQAAEREQGFTEAALKEQKARREQEPPQWRVDKSVRCVACGDAIQPERLRARPDAARCIDCQIDHEAYDRSCP